jgi:3-oxoacyl-[acyl-carrier protein] reductase
MAAARKTRIGDHMDLQLDGRRAAIAASSSGLGLAAARALAAEGARVVICGRDGERVRLAARDLGPDAVGLVADVSNAEGGAAFVEQAREALGTIDILVANGGGPPPGTFASTPLEAYPPALEQSLLSVVAMTQSALPAMREQGFGRLIAITSISVRQPIPNLILSNTARAGITGFLKTVAREVAQDGVTVNSLQPGLHATDRVRDVYGEGLEQELLDIPARELGRPDDFGSLVAFLSSDHARFITGAAIPVDGGSNTALM